MTKAKFFAHPESLLFLVSIPPHAFGGWLLLPIALVRIFQLHPRAFIGWAVMVPSLPCMTSVYPSPQPGQTSLASVAGACRGFRDMPSVSSLLLLLILSPLPTRLPPI